MTKYFLIVATLVLPFSANSKDLVAEEIKKIELSAEIGEMVGADQALRMGGMIPGKKGIPWDKITRHPLFSRKLAKIDSGNAKRIKAIINKHGWLRISEYGTQTAQNVWLLVQHMDHDVAFQEKSLIMMKELLATNEVRKPDYAYLYDRVQINNGKPQLYGSQGHCVDKKWELKPVEDPENLDKRRAEMEMPSIEEYKKMFKDTCTHA